VAELFLPGESPARDHRVQLQKNGLSLDNFFVLVDKFLKLYHRHPYPPLRQWAIKKAEAWILAHQEESGDWGGIQPAMVNSLLALHCLGYAPRHEVIRRGLEALREGSKAREAHEKLARLDPSLADARLIPGLHEYITGSLPWYIRGLAFLAGFRGDRRHGIEQMEMAVQNGRKTAVEARVMLAVVLRRERQYERAAALMGELAEAFPNNFLYRMEEIRLLAEAGHGAQARQRLDSLAQSGLLPAGRIEELRNTVDRILARPASRRKS
jgi:tetratricopeptide (TPR) repeat protein